MAMKPNAETLAERAKWLREQLDGLPPLIAATAVSGSEWIASRTRRVQALDGLHKLLIEKPDLPIIQIDGRACMITMFGVSAISTMGFDGALVNWLVRAEAQSCTRRG